MMVIFLIRFFLKKIIHEVFQIEVSKWKFGKLRTSDNIKYPSKPSIHVMSKPIKTRGVIPNYGIILRFGCRC